MRRKILVTLASLIMIILAGCNFTSASFNLDISEMNLNVGEIYDLNNHITLSSPTIKLTWSSEDEEIAEIDSQGFITAKQIGITNINVQIGIRTNTIQSVRLEISEEDNKPSISIKTDSIGTINQTARCEVTINNYNGSKEVIYQSSDDEILTIDQSGNIKYHSLGSATITVSLKENGEIYNSQIIEVVRPLPQEIIVEMINNGLVGSCIPFKITVLPEYALNDITVEIENKDIAQLNGYSIELLKEGHTDVIFRSKADSNIFVVITININSEDEINNKIENIVSCSFNDLPNGTEIIFKSKKYYVGITAFKNYEDAEMTLGENSAVYFIDEIVNDNITISKNGMKLFGINRDINPTDTKWEQENIFNAKIIINPNLKNIEINGLSFTAGATVDCLGGNDNFVFAYNHIHSTTISTKVWTEDNTYNTGFLVFANYTSLANNITINNNLFEDIGDVAINYSAINNLKIMNNIFDTFNKEAIRSNNGIVNKTSQWLFKGNTFKDGNYSAIFFRTYGTSGTTFDSFISIYDNYFYNVGKIETLYSSAISFRNYQEGETIVNISYNTFEKCNNYLNLRNNAVTANQANYTGYVTYNTFLGQPNSYYFRNKNNSDSTSTNPAQAILRYNFYGDLNKNALVYNNISSKFSGFKENSNIITNYNDLQNMVKVYGQNVAHLESTIKLTADTDVIWQTSNNSILTVSDSGIVTPLALGKATITAISKTNPNQKTEIEITVKENRNIDYVKVLLEKAIGEAGYVEGANNDTKYGTWYGLPNQPWCAMFVSWCANQVGISTNIIPKYASVQIGMDWYKNKGLFQYKENYIPKAGDIIFFKSAGASHTGIVISCDGNKVYTIEGNTSDMVAKRNYSLNTATITGYGTPQYPEYDGEAFVFDVSDSTDGSNQSTT